MERLYGSLLLGQRHSGEPLELNIVIKHQIFGTITGHENRPPRHRLPAFSRFAKKHSGAEKTASVVDERRHLSELGFEFGSRRAGLKPHAANITRFDQTSN